MLYSILYFGTGQRAGLRILRNFCARSTKTRNNKGNGASEDAKNKKDKNADYNAA